MRIIYAALLSAAVALPSFASEPAATPDPTDPGAPVPAVAVPFATDDYKPFQDKPVGSWRDLNGAVTPSKKNGTGMSGMAGMGGMSGMQGMNKNQPSKETPQPSSAKGNGMADMDHLKMPIGSPEPESMKGMEGMEGMDMQDMGDMKGMSDMKGKGDMKGEAGSDSMPGMDHSKMPPDSDLKPAPAGKQGMKTNNGEMGE
ncbi:hypothetical protein [Caballeronia sp. DA-9]|uniref:hypothetical protein n=1 Tax=Caballeronia sp. DA-9 TaxID=3436237 RepID=UPI003F67F8B8